MSNEYLPSISSRADRHSLFLASANHAYTYGDLQNFEYYISEFRDGNKPLGIWADTSDLSVFCIAACWSQGIPFVTLNPGEKPEKLKQQIEKLKISQVLCFTADDKLSTLPVETIAIDLVKILSEKKDHDLKSVSHDPEAVFGYFFTSGTSGDPKIVPLKRRQMYVAAQASANNIQPAEDHFWMLCMPLHHVGGVSLILRSLLYGSAIYRMDKFDAARVAKLISKDKRFAVASLVPTMLKRLLDTPSFKTHRQFKAILLGGGPISSDLLQECKRRQIPVIPSYGMTETCAQIAANPILKSDAHPNYASVGQLFSPNKIEIRDESGAKQSNGTSGSIWLKGPQIFDGYFRPENNANAFDENGWFNTSDFGWLDEEVQLYIEARRTDLIITGGENVSPFEVEAAIENLPEIKEAAVVGLPDEEWGQRIAAVVVTRTNSSSTEVQLQQALQKKLPGFKVPKQICFTDALPRTQTGKIQRAKLPTLFK